MISLICLPHAGGASNIFSQWPSLLGKDVNVIAIDPPGRGENFGQSPIKQMDEMLDWLDQHLPNLDNYALFGHSMGALVSYAYAERRRIRNEEMPRNLFISACKPPPFVPDENSIKKMSGEIFREHLRSYDPINFPFDKYPELWEIYHTVLRSDFELVEDYKLNRKFSVLPVSLTALSGNNDVMAPVSSMGGWKNYTELEFRQYVFCGDHFYLREQNKKIIEKIKYALGSKN